MQHRELEPTQCVERHLSPRLDETVTPTDSSFDRSLELERIRQLEKEIRMLREEVMASIT